VDLRLVNLVMALSFVAAAFAIDARFRDEQDLFADDLAQMSKLAVMVHQPLQVPNAAHRRRCRASSKRSRGGGPKHLGDEGEAGDRQGD
jgi:hypothetical protein